MEASLEQELQTQLQLLNEDQKQSVLAMIKSFFTAAGKNAGRISISAYNAELDRAVAEVHSGQYISQEELERESEKW